MIIYNFFLTVIFLFLSPFLFYGYFLSALRSFSDRSKCYDTWVHCASVGELKMALRFINEYCFRANIEKKNILLTVTNPQALKIARNEHLDTFLFPLDYLFLTRIFLRKIKPKKLIIFETELWPNYIYFAKKYGAKIFLLNGRMTKKTFVLISVLRNLFSFGYLNIDYFLVRESIDFLRFKNLKVNPNRIVISGNMKYDDIASFNIGVNKLNFGFKENDFILCFGSIRKGEEKYIIKAVSQIDSYKYNIKFILAPRHLSDINSLIRILNKYKLSYKKATDNSVNNNFKCLLIDTLGELKKFYFISDLVFVCGSILPYGGQNIIEPVSLKKAVIFGKYMQNFFDPSIKLLKNNGAIKVNDISDLPKIVKDLYLDRGLLERIAMNGYNVINRIKGITSRNIDFILANS